jgi:hypothetical protein
MAGIAWSEWQVVQLQECFMRGIAPEETAALLGRSELEVRAKARELKLLLAVSYEESPSTAPWLSELFPRKTAAS